MSTHNIHLYFYWEIKEINPELLSNTPPSQVLYMQIFSIQIKQFPEKLVRRLSRNIIFIYLIIVH